MRGRLLCGGFSFLFSLPAVARADEPLSTSQQDEDYAEPPVAEVVARGAGWSSPRGLGDVRVGREALDASPRQQASELLSAAPGFFVDHEDGEGLGNDVNLRGFDLDNGSGIEMRLGSIPLNAPLHVHGQGYVDVNFIIPEVVRSVRVLEGPYDPRQGDAAVAGSAYFDLAVPERGYRVSTTFGSFGQARLLAVAAPRDEEDETFAAVSLRHSDGFGPSRATDSGSVNAQYAVSLGARDRVKVIAAAYEVTSALAGVVRQDDVDAGRVDFYGTYASLARNQSAHSVRAIAGLDYDHAFGGGARWEVVPWVMGTDFRARRNFTGSLQVAETDPAVSGRGDLFETTNREGAAGVGSRLHTLPWRLASGVELVTEPGLALRAGHTRQTKSLLDPSTLVPWDRRIDADLDTLDATAYLDLDLRIGRRLRISGGPRVDALSVGVDEYLHTGEGGPQGSRTVGGVMAGPHATAAYDAGIGVVPVVSYGEGFRSLDAGHVADGAAPYSRVRSVEAGLRAQTPSARYVATGSAFATWVDNELVFDATSGGLQTEAASFRRGLVSSLLARPVDWLLASTALTVTSATYTSPEADSHFVPNVPSVLLRADVAAHGTLLRARGKPILGQLGVGYTLVGGRHLDDFTLGTTTHSLNAGAAARYGAVELRLDAYNVLGLVYPDDEEIYVSNWSTSPGPRPASLARHFVAAAPRTLLLTLALHL